MRMLLKATMDTERANQAIRNGTMGKALQTPWQDSTRKHPLSRGRQANRSPCIRLKPPSQLPPLSKFLPFETAAANIHVTPVMSADDLPAG